MNRILCYLYFYGFSRKWAHKLCDIIHPEDTFEPFGDDFFLGLSIKHHRFSGNGPTKIGV